MHNAWLIIEGEKRKTKEFVMKNSPVHKVFRKGNTDTFTLDGRYLGKLKRVILGAMQREDKPLGIIIKLEFSVAGVPNIGVVISCVIYS